MPSAECPCHWPKIAEISTSHVPRVEQSIILTNGSIETPKKLANEQIGENSTQAIKVDN